MLLTSNVASVCMGLDIAYCAVHVQLFSYLLFCYLVLCYVMLCYVMLRYVTLRYVMLCYCCGLSDRPGL